ncbi:MAG: hypothetical protein ACXVA9_06565 [Bdellovibrionales bacterium]
MKSKALLLLVLIAAVATFFWSRPTQKTQVDRPPPPKSLSMKVLKSQAIPRRELEHAKVESSPKEQIPKECVEQWSTAVAASFEHLQEDLKRGVFKLRPECLKFEGGGEILKNAYQACAYDLQHGNLQDENACYAAIAYARNLWADRLTLEQKDYRSMSLALLANKIIARFSQMMNEPAMRAEVVDMINAMIEREPDFFEARKALVAAKLPDFEKPGGAEDMRQATENAMKINSQDPQVIEAYLFVEQATGHSDAVNNFVKSNPDSGLGYYYRAWEAWHGDDRATAVADLRKASTLLPQDARIAKTLHEAEQGSDQNIFSITVGFTFDSP